jgi:hypothetical protein
VNREAHAPFCGSPGVRFPRATRPGSRAPNHPTVAVLEGAELAGRAPLDDRKRAIKCHVECHDTAQAAFPQVNES